MTWLLTSTGRQHYLAGASAQHPDNVPSIAEIAHSLSQINRYTGHASRPYSVAEHSLLVMSIAREKYGANLEGQLAALMHDAHECICGDVASPIKLVLGSVWKEFEDIHEKHMRWAYGLDAVYHEHAAMVKMSDLTALATERRDLLPFDATIHDAWSIIDADTNRIEPWDGVDLNQPMRAAQTTAEWEWLFDVTASKLLKQFARAEA